VRFVLTSLLFAALPAFAAPTLTFDGSCPGEGEFSVAGVEADASFHFVYGEEMGEGSLLTTDCAGYDVGIASPQTHEVPFVVDSSGSRVFDWSITTNYCGKLVRVLDVATCELSDITELPSSDCDWETEVYDGSHCVPKEDPECDWSTEVVVDGACVVLSVLAEETCFDYFSEGYASGFEAGTSWDDGEEPEECEDGPFGGWEFDPDVVPYVPSSGACHVECSPDGSTAVLRGTCSDADKYDVSTRVLGDCAALGQVCGTDVVWVPALCEIHPSSTLDEVSDDEDCGYWTQQDYGCMDERCTADGPLNPSRYSEDWLRVDFAVATCPILYSEDGWCANYAYPRIGDTNFDSVVSSETRRVDGGCASDASRAICDINGQVTDVVTCAADERCYPSLYPDPDAGSPAICAPETATECSLYNEAEATCLGFNTLNICDPHYGIMVDIECSDRCSEGYTCYSSTGFGSFCADGPNYCTDSWFHDLDPETHSSPLLDYTVYNDDYRSPRSSCWSNDYACEAAGEVHLWGESYCLDEETAGLCAWEDGTVSVTACGEDEVCQTWVDRGLATVSSVNYNGPIPLEELAAGCVVPCTYADTPDSCSEDGVFSYCVEGALLETQCTFGCSEDGCNVDPSHSFLGRFCVGTELRAVGSLGAEMPWAYAPGNSGVIKYEGLPNHELLIEDCADEGLTCGYSDWEEEGVGFYDRDSGFRCVERVGCHVENSAGEGVGYIPDGGAVCVGGNLRTCADGVLSEEVCDGDTTCDWSAYIFGYSSYGVGVSGAWGHHGYCLDCGGVSLTGDCVEEDGVEGYSACDPETGEVTTTWCEDGLGCYYPRWDQCYDILEEFCTADEGGALRATFERDESGSAEGMWYGGDCVYETIPLGEACDDGDDSTYNDVIVVEGSQCRGTSYDCPEAPPCASDMIHDGLGGCTPVPATSPYSGGGCDDGDLSTHTDRCIVDTLTCQGTEYTCPSVSACTVGIPTGEAIDSEGQCEGETPVADGTLCDDGNWWTSFDSCSDGVCLGF
jgi:hypothetical protein